MNPKHDGVTIKDKNQILSRTGGLKLERKYWVPALERANEVLHLIAREPDKWKMKDICKRLNISKSTMFSLLLTMEALQWISKNPTDTYSLGVHYGILGNAYFNKFELVDLFNKEAAATMPKIGESIQMASLEGSQVVYLAKINGNSPIQMVSGPGARFPAHATGLGKMLLSGLPETDIEAHYPDLELPQLTPFTIANKEQLKTELEKIRNTGYAEDLQEGVMGFCCVAAPVYNVSSQMIAAVSISMPQHQWEQKREASIEEVRQLAGRLSLVK